MWYEKGNSMLEHWNFKFKDSLRQKCNLNSSQMKLKKKNSSRNGYFSLFTKHFPFQLKPRDKKHFKSQFWQKTKKKYQQVLPQYNERK